MQVSLFRALKSANISDDAAEKVVHAFEEHIDMAVAEAMKHYDDRITAMQSILEAKIDAGFKNIEGRFTGIEGRFTGIEGRMTGMQTSIDVLKWLFITQATLLLIAGTVAGYVKLIT
ncbi:hypothetical protein [Novosphingobium sp. 9U]|uniref:hypothetical protein n=1 Tax=Novosphingobium sp. 9U TaxID=2653158 RepID=UPI0012F2B64D|nr:hypothetical protein [Novosphingobium sp. 9U]VWX51076.1 conserved hypothetical protein [Novosphingobium sp. 9U]